MKADIAEKWVAKLRSGDIEQSHSALGRVDGTRCCLGVLCDIAVEENIIPSPSAHTNTRGTKLFYGLENPGGGYLPAEVQKWAGMKTRSGHIYVKDSIESLNYMLFGENKYVSLADANDSELISFNQIADAIVTYKEML